MPPTTRRTSLALWGLVGAAAAVLGACTVAGFCGVVVDFSIAPIAKRQTAGLYRKEQSP